MNWISVVALVVSAIAAVLVGVNLYFALRPRPRDEGRDALLESLVKSVGDQNLSLNQRLDSVVRLVNDQLEKNRQSAERTTQGVMSQVQSFVSGMTAVQETVKQVQDKVKDIVSFQDIFRSPKLRGTWGEFSLEAALGQYFSRDIYELQHYFKSGEAVDAVLKLPNDLVLPIDSKFNWENFEKMVNADNEMSKEMFRKTFVTDVKKKIDDISAKYILPAEGTTDFALMYVPAETIYYEIINNIKEPDIPAYARSKKVYLVSPNSFGLSVSSIRQWFQNVEVSKRTKEIIERLGRIRTDGEKLGDTFRKLGKHISDAHSSYDDSEKRLNLMVDRVKNVIEIGAKKEAEKLTDGSSH